MKHFKGEYAENELRKEFTPSERVEIGRAIEEELKGRNGIRHDTASAQENFPELKGQTRDIAAEKRMKAGVAVPKFNFPDVGAAIPQLAQPLRARGQRDNDIQF